MRQAEKHTVFAERVFDGAAFVDNAAVIIQGPHILAVVPRDAVPANMPRYALPDGACLVPGFIDLQVNGGGVLVYALAQQGPSVLHLHLDRRWLSIDKVSAD